MSPRVRILYTTYSQIPARPSVWPPTVCNSVNRRRHRLQTHIVVPRYESAPIVADGRFRNGHDFGAHVAWSPCQTQLLIYMVI